jgi:glycerophosphoryl diester phosphodiesterase
MSVPVQVLAHRGLLHGPDHARENALPALREAAARGFASEFDVRADADGRLVLTHDPAAWAPEHDALTFLAEAPGDVDALHAFNVKDADATRAALDAIADAGTLDRFFFFDFELACPDAVAADALRAEVAERGGAVARRLSDREPVLDDLVADAATEHVWLDEMDGPWVDRTVVARLRDAGKRVWFVSPELHRPQPLAALRRRWDDVLHWGVTGICTDHPLALSGAAV